MGLGALPQRIATLLGHMVHPALPYRDGTLGQVVVLVHPRSHLLVGLREQLAAILALAALEDNEGATVIGSPEDDGELLSPRSDGCSRMSLSASWRSRSRP